MFITNLADFDYKPYVKDGELRRNKVVTETTLLWRPADGIEDIIVPAGFVTDLASLPWFSSFALKKLGKHQRGAVLHDWLYRNKTEGKGWADTQFSLAMEQDGVKRWRRAVIMSGLKIGGFIGWNKDKVIEVIT